MNRVPVPKEQFDELYKVVGKDHFLLQSEIQGRFGKEILNMYLKLVDFTYHIVTVLGVVAGLGFTGLGYVKNLKLFVAGELVFFVGIAYGIFLVQFVYTGELLGLQKSLNKIKDHFRTRNELATKMLTEAAEQDSVSKEDIESLKKIDNETIKIFDMPNDDHKWTLRFKLLQVVLIILVIIGGVLVLSSLFGFDSNFHHQYFWRTWY